MPKGFQYNRTTESRFQQNIFKLLGQMLPKFSGSFEEWIEDLIDMRNHNPFFHYSKFVAGRMVNNVNVENARNWREAAQRNQRSRMLYAGLMQEMAGDLGVHTTKLVNENAELIRSIPSDVALKLNGQIAKLQMAGVRHGTIAKAMKAEFTKLTTSKVKLIARTQTAAASSIITEARAESIGLDWFEWLTSEDQRVRPSHEKMSSVLVSWHDLPSPEKLIGQKSTLGRYAPGRCPNCRCTPAPLLTVDDVSWPHKVYHNGALHNMTRAQFMMLSGIGRRKAA